MKVARQNASINSVPLKFLQQDLKKLPLKCRRQYDLVCANMEFDLLISEVQKICNRVKPGGRLVLAGILTTQFDRVVAVFAQAGFKLLSKKIKNEWCSGAFEI